jgi:mRNA interferase YafQ
MRLSQTSQFKKDIKRQKKRGKDPGKLKAVVEILVTGKPLPREYQDHPLLGKWVGRRDCHLEPDWILIYCLFADELRLERTGTHSDLFG